MNKASKRLRVGVATSTRADWGLLQPLASALREAGAEVGVMASNMHLLNDSGHTIDEIRADGFEPVAQIAPGADAASTFALTSEGMARALRAYGPDCLIILGDRYEMAGTAMAAVMAGVPIVHIAGGTISEGAFDDSFRHVITKLATLHFPETEQSRRRIIQMGESPERVLSTGALGIHNLLRTQLMDRDELESSISFRLDKTTLLTTLHAATLDPLPPMRQLENLLEALDRTECRILFTHPNNDVDPAPLIKRIDAFCAEKPEQRRVIPSLGRIRYLSALRYVGAVVGNSSSGIVEVPSAGIPTLDIGCRQQGRDRADSVIHCGSSAEEIAGGLRRVLDPETQAMAARCKNPYEGSDTLATMVREIMRFPFHPFPTKHFYDYK